MSNDFQEFLYTPAQAKAFTPYADVLDKNDKLQFGKYEGWSVENVPLDYLKWLVASRVGDAIVLQQIVDKLTGEDLVETCLMFPTIKDWLIDYKHRMKGITLTEEQLVRLEGCDKQEDAF